MCPPCPRTPVNHVPGLYSIAKELNEKRRAFNASIEDKLRELARGGLDAHQQRADKILEIEQKLALARQALANGNTKLAEEYAQKAISLAEQTATAVKSADGKEISQKDALYQAQQLILGGQNLINQAIGAEAAAASNSADAFAKQKNIAVDSLRAIKSEIDRVTESLAKGVALRITIDTKSLNDEIAAFRGDIEKQEAIQKVKLQLVDAKADIAVLKKSIEDGLDGVIVKADLTNLKNDVDAAIKALPGVNITVKAEELTALNTAFDGLVAKAKNFTEVKVTVESNLKVIAAEISDLTKLSTTSKHTVVVNYVTADGKPALPPTSTTVPLLTTFNRGGLVSAASMPRLQNFSSGGAVAAVASLIGPARRASIARFAKGGSVGKVPGVGNSDSVRADLRQGDFILRKKPSELLELLAAENAYTRGRGIGGDPSKPNDLTRLRGIGGDPSNPNYLTRLRGLNPTDAGAPAGAGGIDNSPVTTSADQDLIAKVKAAPVFGRAGLLDALMTATVNAELAWLKKARTLYGPNGVDPAAEFNTTVQGRAFAQATNRDYANAVSSRNAPSAEDITSRVTNGADTAFKTLAGLRVKDRFDGFAGGGEAAANVPALLTPGELHFDREAVKQFGLRNLLALNSVNTEREMRSRLRFNNGGPVGMPPSMSSGLPDHAHALYDRLERFNLGGAVNNSNATNNTTNINVPAITINAGSSVNERQLARVLRTELSEIDRRAK